MNELRLSALRVQQMVMNLGLEQIQKNAPTLEKQLNNAVKILQRRQIRIEIGCSCAGRNNVNYR